MARPASGVSQIRASKAQFEECDERQPIARSAGCAAALGARLEPDADGQSDWPLSRRYVPDAHGLLRSRGRQAPSHTA